RGLFGKPRDEKKIEDLLKRLSLWDKRKTIMMHLSGGMKRRVMIAKALSHEPSILFLDEPTAGVDVELRRDMWELVRQLRADGTGIASLMRKLTDAGIAYKDLSTHQSSLEDIFVELVHGKREPA